MAVDHERGWLEAAEQLSEQAHTVNQWAVQTDLKSLGLDGEPTAAAIISAAHRALHVAQRAVVESDKEGELLVVWTAFILAAASRMLERLHP